MLQRYLTCGTPLPLAFAFLALALPGRVNAQRTCAAMDVLQQEIAADPERAARLQMIEEHTAHFVATDDPAAERAVVTIPVVFHVVWRTSAENIPDAKLLAQLQQLNDDFARLNSDASQTPALFAPLGANTEVQFCLAQRDPQGNATTGIVRRQTTVTSFSSNNAVKYTANGGSDAWPRDSYLNVWVCNLSGGLLGYAQFPGGAAATDGVVVLYSSVGSLTNPGTAAPFHYGRTLTHEVGHWLNLRHIWGDATCGNDLVSDTPVHQTSNGGCPAFPKTNTCGGTSNTEMTMNYMDYTDDGCMNIFTLGQKSRMQALFATGGARVALLNSLGCTPPGGGGGTCAVPTGTTTSNITTNSATLSWNAVSGAVGYTVQYRQAGGTWSTGSVSGTSASLTGLNAGTTYEWGVRADCSGTSSAYSATVSFTTASPACSDTWESNNSSSSAKTIPVNTDVKGLISSSTDVDWFKFNNTSSQPRIRIDLTTLPADYDVRLYRGTSTQVGISQNGGTANEVIILNTSTVATYYVRVYGYNGAFNTTQCYTLKASISSSNFREGAPEEELTPVPVDEAGGIMGLYPNPASDKLMLDYLAASGGPIELMVLDGMGRTVITARHSVGEGPQTLVLPLPALANGMYVLQVAEGERRHQQRFVVEY